MDQQPENQGVGASMPVLATIASVVGVAVLVGGFYLYRAVSSESAYSDLVIATGSESGTYHALGEALVRVLNNTESFTSVKALATDGSEENIGLIGSENSGVDLAFVQGDASPISNGRLVMTLYDEALHILISKSAAQKIETIYDLQGKRAALGPEGSGTRDLATRVLHHLGVELGEDLVLTPVEAAAQLAAGTIDAAFMLTAIPSQLISRLAEQDAIRFLSLGSIRETGDEAHALELVFPGVRRDTIPRSTYVRLPRQAVQTISVAAALIAREDLPDDLVGHITATIFNNRSGEAGLEGSGLMAARKIRENYDPASAIIPYHPGAATYYRREEPPFFVEYAEALSLGLTVMLAIYSAFIAIREWSRRRMKNRIDAYLLNVESLAIDRQSLDREALQGQLTALEDFRRAAFADLIAERLLADEAFTILQNHLRDEVAAIEALIQLKSG